MSDSQPKNPTETVVPQGGDDGKGANLPKTQQELDALLNRVLAPKLSKITELEGQVTSLTAERDQATAQAASSADEIAQLQQENAASKRALVVQRVASTKGVPEKYLSGDTEEDLAASADEYLNDARAALGIGAGGSETPPSPSATNTVPSAGTGDESPAKPSYQERLKEAYEKARKGEKGVTI